jgi:hypothetical protein
MARPRVENGEDGLQTWKVAANILNKHSQRADKRWSFSLVLGGRLTTLHRKRKKQLVAKCYKGPQTWTDSLEQPRQREMDMNLGAWNVRSLYGAGSLRAVESELLKRIIRVTKSKRMRWTGQVARMVEVKKHTKFCPENMKGKDHSEDLGVDWKIILEWILEKQGGNLWTGSIWLGTETRGGLL